VSQTTNIHEDFLTQVITKEQRVAYAKKLKKTPGEINSLTAYHDFCRLESINKHLAKIYIVAGIRWVWELKKLNEKQVSEKIKKSRIWWEVNVHSEIIIQSITEAKNTKLLVQGLEKEDYFLQRKWYIFSKTPNTTHENKEIKSNNNDISLFIIMLIILCVFSFVSLYFVALIPALLAIHILLKSKIWDFFIQPFMSFIPMWWILWVSSAILSISACVFAIWFFSWNIHNSLTNTFDLSGENAPATFFPSAVHTHYEDRDITREELIKMLVVSKKIDMSEWQEIDCFKDSFQSEYPKELCYAKDQWFIQWDSEWNFKPTGSVSHAAGLKFILNFYWYRVPKESLYITFTDLQKRQWQTTYAEFAKRIWIISPTVTEFHPERTISIDQVDWYLQALSSK